MAKTAPADVDPFFEVWRRVPPEEKLELMARAQAAGVSASLVIVSVCATVSIGLKLPWLFYGAFVGIPFIFQFASSKAWRDIKPRAMLEYLAARSAARRYAFGTHCQDLTTKLMFKGYLSQRFSAEEESQEMEAEIDNRQRKEVWVALFPDTIVMLSERPGGASLELAYSIDQRLSIASTGFDDDDRENRSVILGFAGRDGITRSFALTSRYPAALMVFERQIKVFAQLRKEQAEKDAASIQTLFGNPVDTDSKFEGITRF